MALSTLLCSVPLRVLLAFLNVYFIGFLSTGELVKYGLHHAGFPSGLSPRKAAPPPSKPDEPLLPTPRADQLLATGPAAIARGTAMEDALGLSTGPEQGAVTPLAPSRRLLVVPPTKEPRERMAWAGRSGFRLRRPVTSESGVDEAYFLAVVESPEARPSPAVLLPPEECQRLDTELTGLWCFEATDPETRERCHQLHTACTLRHFDQVDIQRDFPLHPPSCAPPTPRIRGATCVPAPTTKFFKESLGSGHLDERWAHVLTTSQQQQALQSLFRAWAAFTRERGLRYWLFGGGLIGWFFNKDALPWDDDLDVQVLASDLLSQAHYGQYDGMTYHNQYLFEVNPNSVHRAPDGSNFIDARFIDKETGVFVDIVAVSHNADTQALQCKHGETFIPAHIFPIRKTTFMGEEAWVPYDVPRFLFKKYGPKVVLHQQPHHHPTSRCPPFGPCAVYRFHPENSKWVDERQRLQ